MKALLLLLVLGGLLALALFAAPKAFDPSVLSLNGWIALGLGVFLSIALGGGLMALSFYSARKGFDDRVGSEILPDDPS